MASLHEDATFGDLQEFIRTVYGQPNDLQFDVSDVLANMTRFGMRALKGVRKGDPARLSHNLLISFSWFITLMNRMHIDIAQAIWERFPYYCSYCDSCPCACDSSAIASSPVPRTAEVVQPVTISDCQQMFNVIYPARARTIEHASVHFAEEIGELIEAVHGYRGRHSAADLVQVSTEAADLASCVLGICNSADLSFAACLAVKYSADCHACHRTPCICTYEFVMNYKS